MLRNNNYFNTSKNKKSKKNYLDKIKYRISTTSNIINEYKKISKTKFLNSDIKLSKTNSIYNKNNNTLNKDRESLTGSLFKNDNKIKNKLNSGIYDNYMRNKIDYDYDYDISNNQNNFQAKTNNNFYNEDTDHSSMETIKKILYSTDSKKDVKKDNNMNNLLKSSQINGLQNLKSILNKNKINNKKDEKIHPITLFKNNTNVNMKKSNHEKNNTNIDLNLINKINKELTFNAKKSALKSKKYIKTNNNYDFDNINNSNLNISDEFKNIIEEREMITSNKNNIYQNNKNNYNVRKIHNNIYININNNKTDKKKLNNNNKNYIKRYNSGDLDSNFLNISGIKNDTDDLDNNDIFYLKEKIRELTEEINNKNILINEYSNLTRKSKIKFEQLMMYNTRKMEQIQKEAKKQSMLYRAKIINIDKEKKNILNKYLENKQYTEFLEGLLFNGTSPDNNGNSNDENKKIKNLENIIKNLMTNVSVMKVELDKKNKDNERLKNMIIKYKDNKNFRAISNPRKNINIMEQMKDVHSKSKNFNMSKNKELSSNLDE